MDKPLIEPLASVHPSLEERNSMAACPATAPPMSTRTPPVTLSHVHHFVERGPAPLLAPAFNAGAPPPSSPIISYHRTRVRSPIFVSDSPDDDVQRLPASPLLLLLLLLLRKAAALEAAAAPSVSPSTGKRRAARPNDLLTQQKSCQGCCLLMCGRIG